MKGWSKGSRGGPACPSSSGAIPPTDSYLYLLYGLSSPVEVRGQLTTQLVLSFYHMSPTVQTKSGL